MTDDPYAKTLAGQSGNLRRAAIDAGTAMAVAIRFMTPLQRAEIQRMADYEQSMNLLYVVIGDYDVCNAIGLWSQSSSCESAHLMQRAYQLALEGVPTDDILPTLRRFYD